MRVSEPTRTRVISIAPWGTSFLDFTVTAHDLYLVHLPVTLILQFDN